MSKRFNRTLGRPLNSPDTSPDRPQEVPRTAWSTGSAGRRLRRTARCPRWAARPYSAQVIRDPDRPARPSLSERGTVMVVGGEGKGGEVGWENNRKGERRWEEWEKEIWGRKGSCGNGYGDDRLLLQKKRKKITKMERDQHKYKPFRTKAMTLIFYQYSEKSTKYVQQVWNFTQNKKGKFT